MFDDIMMYNQTAIIQGWSRHRNLYGCPNNIVHCTKFGSMLILLIFNEVINADVNNS